MIALSRPEHDGQKMLNRVRRLNDVPTDCAWHYMRYLNTAYHFVTRCITNHFSIDIGHILLRR